MVDFSDVFQNNMSVNTLINSLSEGVIFINKEGKIVLANNNACELFGYTHNELFGEIIEKLIPNKYKHSHHKHIQEYFKSPKTRPMGNLNSKLSGLKKDGNEFPVEISLSHIKSEEEPFSVAFIMDISARIKAENELKKRNLELDAFAHTIAHELHSQLNSVIGFSQLLLNNNELSSAKKTSFLEMIVASGFKMNSIIREILLFASAKKEEIVKTPLSMTHIITEVLKRIPAKEKMNTEIIIPNNFAVSIGYGPWIEEVWYNYITNAIKYGKTPAVIEIGSSQWKDGYNKFWVKDNGKGLSDKECEFIFTDPEKLGENFIKGHGLGLSIVNKMVTKLDGWVKVESTPNHGSIFSFFLPTLPDK